MAGDAAYAQTRRRGKKGTITQVVSTSANPQTGQQTEQVKNTVVRWMVKDPTSYSRLYRAEATQQDVGDTTFTMWTGDEAVKDLTRLEQEDYITWADGRRYEVVSTVIEDTSLVVTAKEMV